MSMGNKTISMYFYFVPNFHKIHLHLLNYRLIHLLSLLMTDLFSMLQNYVDIFLLCDRFFTHRCCRCMITSITKMIVKVELRE
jgi:hypothetical protein